MPQQVAQVGGVDRHRDGAKVVQREHDSQRKTAVAQHQQYRVAAAYVECGQAIGSAAHLV